MFQKFIEVAMKKISVLFAFFLAFLIVENGNAKQQVWITQDWENEEWVNIEKDQFIYDGDNISEVIFHIWSGSDWFIESRTSYSYDSQGYITSYVYDIYEGSEWITDMRINYYYEEGNIVKTEMYFNEEGELTLATTIQYTYNSKGLLEEYEYYQYDEGESFLFMKDTYTYDALDREIENISFRIDYMTFELMPSMKITSTYESNNENPSIETQYDWDEDEWVETDRELYSYNAKGYVIEVIYQIWQEAWVNLQREETQWNNDNNESQFITQFWNGEAWENDSKELNEYNNGGYNTRNLFQSWLAGEWRNIEESLMYYDDDDMYLNLDRVWENEEWVNVSRSFREGALSAANITKNVNIDIYPNPTASTLNLSFSLENPAFVRANIYSLDARSNLAIINSYYQQGEHIEIVDVNDLTNGTYLLNFQTGTNNFIRKFVINK